jgi:hypothetical protein
MTSFSDRQAFLWESQAHEELLAPRLDYRTHCITFPFRHKAQPALNLATARHYRPILPFLWAPSCALNGCQLELKCKK